MTMQQVTILNEAQLTKNTNKLHPVSYSWTQWIEIYIPDEEINMFLFVNENLYINLFNIFWDWLKLNIIK